MSDDKPILPALIGMPRSASRMTWQILKFLLPEQRPEWWTVDGHTLPEGDWPVRRHGYLGGRVPLVYTYRHPVEAYLSYYSRVLQDVGRMKPTRKTEPDPVTGLYQMDRSESGLRLQTKEAAAKDTMQAMGDQWELHKLLKQDQSRGREVLFLRYEDYFDDPLKRVAEISRFMNIDVTDNQINKILTYTSLSKNAQRGEAIAKFLPNAIFGDGHHPTSGIQKGHVNLETMGKPGAHIQKNQDFVRAVIEGAQPAYQALNEMCVYLGYDPAKV